MLALTLLATLVAVPASSWAQTPPQPAQPSDPAPEIGARAAVLIEYPSGRILYSKAMHDRLAPASTTKILTAILALEHGNLEAVVTVSPNDVVGESAMGIVGGEQQTLHNLLYGMLLPSGNDAATATARYLGAQSAAPLDGGPLDNFIEMMNTRAAQLGLTNSHFVNPHGLDADNHYSSAYDLASLTWYAMHFPTFNEIVQTRFYDAPGHSLKNTNEMLVRYPGADGVKTGWTDAGGLCLVASATRDGHRLISVVLNAPQWYLDSAALLDYGFAQLAADPHSTGAEILAIVTRGTGSWLLANNTSTLPIPAQIAVSMAQGGGAASAPALEAAQPASGIPIAAVNLQTKSKSNGDKPLGLILFLLLFGVAAFAAGWLAFVMRRPGLAPRLLGALIPFRTAREDATISDFIRHSPPRAPVPVTARPTLRTLGDAPMPRRREPNLMLTTEQVCASHIERAVALAVEGKQGSSMAEFLLALRSGCCLNVAEIDRQHDLSPTGFLALHGAQSAARMFPEAWETIQYATAAVPGDRMIALTLRQFSNSANSADSGQWSVASDQPSVAS